VGICHPVDYFVNLAKHTDTDTYDFGLFCCFSVSLSPHLGLSSTFEELYKLAKPMADCVVPQEYGTTVAEKRSVGVKICHGLLEKIKYDLSVARTDNEVDMRYMINMAYSADLPINTMGRRIRTRLYFTSESHLHTVLSVFRFAQCEQNSNIGGKKRRKRHKHPLLSERGMSIINGTPELCYLTQIVMRVFEDNRRAMDDPCRFRVEILFSPGATATPRVMDEKEREQDTSRFDTAPLQVIGREGLTCQEVEDFFEQAIMAGRTDEDTPYDVASTVAMPESPPQHQASMTNKDAKAAADDGQQNAKALSTAETGSETATALQADADKLLGKDETSAGRGNAVKNDDASSACSENATTLTRSNRASMGRALLKERMELDTKIESVTEEKEVTDVSQTLSLGLGNATAADDDQDKNKEDNTKEDPPSSNAELSTTRKYFWGTVAVASFGLGAACLFMALTFPMDRRGYRRWPTTRGRY
jgi:Histidine phosphatase superfamily (branch 2)